jgi:NhaP-type Na+/H+ and K+/H+ antiporter
MAPEGELHYHTVTLAADAPAVGQAVRALDLPAGVLLVTIERDQQTLAPQGGTLLSAGDRITLFAPPQQLSSALVALTGRSSAAEGSSSAQFSDETPQAGSKGTGTS